MFESYYLRRTWGKKFPSRENFRTCLCRISLGAFYTYIKKYIVQVLYKIILCYIKYLALQDIFYGPNYNIIYIE